MKKIPLMLLTELRGLNLPILSFLILFVVNNLHAYRVVLDPGHGGKKISPQSIYGDKYDPAIGRYLDIFRPGAYYNGLHEYQEVYAIAEKVRDLLELTHSAKGRKEFHQILLKYDRHADKPEEPIEVFISRPPGYTQLYHEIKEDLNALYRLYDYPHIDSKELMPGTLSRINAYRPHLVVSMHLTGGASGDHGALSSVVTPGYDTFALALDYVHSNHSMRQTIQQSFTDSPYAHWMASGQDRSLFEWFLCDSWIYFTGYWSAQDGLSADTNRYRGRRHNMVTWSYRDDAYLQADLTPFTSYVDDLRQFTPQGDFWMREMSIQERWRRQGGYEGYGGDNLYASNEILRFIRKGLHVDKVRKSDELPDLKSPYFSTWSVPTYVNAISAYLELAYIDNPLEADRIQKHKDTHAEAIAAGIYSLFYGTKQKNKTDDFPKGMSIDFQRYETFGGENYFESVVREDQD